MSPTAKRPRKARRASATPRKRASVAKVTPITVRLAPDLQRGMEILRRTLKRPVNKMINEAVRGFIQKRTAEVEADLEEMLAKIKAYRRHNANFDPAFHAWADAEAKLGSEDPAEGVVVNAAKASTGPTQTLVRELLLTRGARG